MTNRAIAKSLATMEFLRKSENFRRQINIGLTAMTLLIFSFVVITIFSLVNIVPTINGEITEDSKDLVTTLKIALSLSKMSGTFRGYMINGDMKYLAESNKSRKV